ncbi:MAG: ABC transporter substrate-binding protein [Burkholderiales bacterium]|nr:ABC transporter substrate-binding protein [Burkholderiales bacterium]
MALGVATLLPRHLAARSSDAPATVRRVGLLSLFSAAEAAAWHKAFHQGLRDLGWVEGRNLRVDYRYSEGHDERLPGLAVELVRLKVDLIVASSTPEALAAVRATREIPIVMVVPGDPVATGLVKSLAHPGGNITGLTTMSPQLAGKRLELLKEIVPGLSRVAVLWNPESAVGVEQWKESQLPARQLGIRLQSLELRHRDELDKVLEEAIRTRAGALVAFAGSTVTSNLKRIADFAVRNRLPSIFQYSYYTDAGGLAAYGPDRLDLYRRAAGYVDRIFKGARPGNLPIEQPTKFELVVNLKTAKALGLTIPPVVMLRADRVIE